MQRFKGVATKYLDSYLGWFRMLGRSGPTGLQPALVLGAAMGNQLSLGAVENQRELITAAARWIIAAKLVSVLSLRIAMRSNSLSLQKEFSIK